MSQSCDNTDGFTYFECHISCITIPWEITLYQDTETFYKLLSLQISKSLIFIVKYFYIHNQLHFFLKVKYSIFFGHLGLICLKATCRRHWLTLHWQPILIMVMIYLYTKDWCHLQKLLETEISLIYNKNNGGPRTDPWGSL